MLSTATPCPFALGRSGHDRAGALSVKRRRERAATVGGGSSGRERQALAAATDGERRANNLGRRAGMEHWCWDRTDAAGAGKCRTVHFGDCCKGGRETRDLI